MQWWGRHGGRGLAYGPDQEVEEGNVRIYVAFSFPLCCLGLDHSQWNGIPHLQGGFLHLVNHSLEIIQTRSMECLINTLSVSYSNQVHS